MSDPFLAEIRIFAGNFAPRNWAFCNGQLLQISQNTALFSLIGTTYGGDGRTVFNLPNLQGRAPAHPGNGPGLPSYRLGQVQNSPSNVKVVQGVTPDRNLGSSQTTRTIAAKVPAGDQRHPYLGLNFIIALQGLFPPRS